MKGVGRVGTWFHRRNIVVSKTVCAAVFCKANSTWVRGTADVKMFPNGNAWFAGGPTNQDGDLGQRRMRAVQRGVLQKKGKFNEHRKKCE